MWVSVWVSLFWLIADSDGLLCSNIGSILAVCRFIIIIRIHPSLQNYCSSQRSLPHFCFDHRFRSCPPLTPFVVTCLACWSLSRGMLPLCHHGLKTPQSLIESTHRTHIVCFLSQVLLQLLDYHGTLNGAQHTVTERWGAVCRDGSTGLLPAGGS